MASHEVAAEFREFERASTTIADAYLGPVAGRYLRRLAGTAAAEGLPAPAVMQSNGGVCDLEEAAAHPARLLLSGPAGGVAAVVAAGIPDAISFDMGGTSTDVCLIRGGVAGRSAERRVGGLPLRLPQLDIHTVGAGGGSIAWLDPGGALRVGPASAGADPGPACYGRGGERPTVTDANLVLGRLDPGVPLADGLRLDVDAPHRALRAVAEPVRRRPRRRRGRRRGRKRRDGARDRRRQRRAGPRSRASSSWWRSAAPGRCMPARWPTAWACARWWCRPRAACSPRSGSPRASGAGSRSQA